MVATSSAGAAVMDAAPAGATWGDRLHIAGTLEMDLVWAHHSDVAERGTGSSLDPVISTAELWLGLDAAPWITAEVLLLMEDVDAEGSDDGVMLDEALITFQREGDPFYLKIGKRAQPFGVFESHLVADPMGQDAYETNRLGMTLGFTGLRGMDLSMTLYREQEMLPHLFESGLFASDPDDLGVDPVALQAGPVDGDLDSYLLSVLFSPPAQGELTFFAAMLSEPGHGRRNVTANLGVHLAVDSVRLDGEYTWAIQREAYVLADTGDHVEAHEAVASLSAGYEFYWQARDILGAGRFAERQSHILSEPLEVVARYEYFDDDGLADRSAAWSVQDRYGAGGRMTLYQGTDDGVATYLALEYRHTDYRLHPSQARRAKDNDEVLVRLGVTF